MTTSKIAKQKRHTGVLVIMHFTSCSDAAYTAKATVRLFNTFRPMGNSDFYSYSTSQSDNATQLIADLTRKNVQMSHSIQLFSKANHPPNHGLVDKRIRHLSNCCRFIVKGERTNRNCISRTLLDLTMKPITNLLDFRLKFQ